MTYKQILIIEDDKSFCEILSRSFERRGYEVKIANCLREIDEILTKFHPFYAVVDLKLGTNSGLECIKTLKHFNAKL